MNCPRYQPTDDWLPALLAALDADALVLLPTDAAAGATCQFEAVTKTLSIGGIYDKYFIPDL